MSQSDSAENSCGSQLRYLSLNPGERSENRTLTCINTEVPTRLRSKQPNKDDIATVNNMTIKTNRELLPSHDGEGSGISVSLYKNSVPVLAVSETVDPSNSTDFGYSQKLFHIADGNLYSVFSPIQGRSYGVRPAFLRKQRGAGRQLRGRGRRSHRRGLKFHNFVPSEASLSERNVFGNDEVRNHPECMLREEHGTKQITASHWSVTADTMQNEDSIGSSDVTSNNGKQKAKDEVERLTTGAHSSVCDNSRNEVLPEESQEVTPSSKTEQCDVTKPPLSEDVTDTLIANENKSRHGILEMLLSVSKPTCKRNGGWHSVQDKILEGKVETASRCETTEDDDDNQSDDIIIDWEGSSQCSSRKHRRKPIQTRRVVPYSEYLMLVEDNSEEPLDLSCHSRQSTSSDAIPNLPSVSVSLGRSPSHSYANQSCEACLSGFNAGFFSPHKRGVWDVHPTKQREIRPLMPPRSHFESALQLNKNSQIYQTKVSVAEGPRSMFHTEHMRNLSLLAPARNEADLPDVPHPIAYVYPVGLVPPRSENVQEFTRSSNLPVQHFGFPAPGRDVPSSYNRLVNIMPNFSNLSNSGSSNVGEREANSSPKGRTTEQVFLRYSTSNLKPMSSALISETDSNACGQSSRLPSLGNMESSNHGNPMIAQEFKVPRAQRRPSQRTLIRQKLEDAFRQNGFLVKTKQVPVGEATFCKFRQLRKYTRYYLKSWHQHLPEEVHKLWKGFLPPKTAVAQASAGRLEDRPMESTAGMPSKGVS